MTFSALIPPNRCGLRDAALSNLRLLNELGHASITTGDMLPLIYEHRMPDPAKQAWRDGRKCIGYWVCESDKANPLYKEAMDAYAQIWTASEQSAQALRAIGSKTPVYVVPHAVPVPDKQIDRSGRDTVTTLFAFMPPMERKNPEALLRAWLAAFPRDSKAKLSTTARLIIKMRNSPPSLTRLLELVADEDDRIEIINKDLTEAEMLDLYDRADLWCSLQRAGAFELHIAQSAAHGLPIITTAIGGPLDYLSDEAAFFIGGPEIDPLQDCTLNAVGKWMEPDQAEVIAALRKLAGNAKLRAKMGASAREGVKVKLSDEAVKFAMNEALPAFEKLPTPAISLVRPERTMPPAHLAPIRAGLDVVGQEEAVIGMLQPVILSHRRSGTHLLGTLLQKHWGYRCWLKSHDWPERRPLSNPAVYVLRNPIDALYSTYQWWRSDGGAGNPEISAIMDKLSFEQWLNGDAGKIIGYQSWRCGDRDNFEVTRGQMYDPIRYWRDHWRAAQEAGLTVVLYEDLVRHPQSLVAVLTAALGVAPKTALEVIEERVGLAPSPVTKIGDGMKEWPGHQVARLDSLLSPDLMQSIGIRSRAEWLGQ